MRWPPGRSRAASSCSTDAPEGSAGGSAAAPGALAVAGRLGWSLLREGPVPAEPSHATGVHLPVPLDAGLPRVPGQPLRAALSAQRLPGPPAGDAPSYAGGGPDGLSRCGASCDRRRHRHAIECGTAIRRRFRVEPSARVCPDGRIPGSFRSRTHFLGLEHLATMPAEIFGRRPVIPTSRSPHELSIESPKRFRETSTTCVSDHADLEIAEHRKDPVIEKPVVKRAKERVRWESREVLLLHAT